VGRCSIYTVDVLSSGKFRPGGFYEINEDSKRDYWKDRLGAEVSAVNTGLLIRLSQIDTCSANLEYAFGLSLWKI
jgi:hypothetical protein